MVVFGPSGSTMKKMFKKGLSIAIPGPGVPGFDEMMGEWFAFTSGLTALTRHDSGRVLAVLARRFGDLDLADEAVQEALVEAATAWQRKGILPIQRGGCLPSPAEKRSTYFVDVLRLSGECELPLRN